MVTLEHVRGGSDATTWGDMVWDERILKWRVGPLGWCRGLLDGWPDILSTALPISDSIVVGALSLLWKPVFDNGVIRLHDVYNKHHSTWSVTLYKQITLPTSEPSAIDWPDYAERIGANKQDDDGRPIQYSNHTKARNKSVCSPSAKTSGVGARVHLRQLPFHLAPKNFPSLVLCRRTTGH